MNSYENNELQHYGVKGMRWGVRRAKKSYAKATATGNKDKIEKLDAKMAKHKTKATNTIKKLEKAQPQLEKNVQRHKQKTDIKAAKISAEAARLRRKANRPLVSDKRAQSYLTDAMLKQAKADDLKARSDKAKMLLEANADMQRTFNKGINEINKLTVDKGKQYIKYGKTIDKAKKDYKDGKITRKERRHTVRNTKIDRKNYLNAI